MKIGGSERQNVSGKILRGDEHILYEDCGSGVMAMYACLSKLIKVYP